MARKYDQAELWICFAMQWALIIPRCARQTWRSS
jgi:hypothetical protein